ncbi:MAG: alpha-amylase family protein, partial [bacterium]
MKSSKIIVMAMLITNLGFSQESHVALYNGVPTLFINDEAIAPTSLFVYEPPNNKSQYPYDSPEWLPAYKGLIDKVASTGLSYLGIRWYFFYPMFETGTEPEVYGSEIDFTKMDALFDYAEEKGVYLMPSIWTSWPPEWWREQHEDELQHDYTNPPIIDEGVSLNNPDYWEVMDEYIRVSVERYRSHPALLGWDVRVGITNENNYGPSYTSDPDNPPTSWADYSPYAKGRFQSWLEERYGSIEALNSAWGSQFTSFDDVEPPMPEEPGGGSPELAANGAGDTRPEMKDWLEFRLDEKGEDWNHFIDLVESLDPDHIIAMNPVNPLLTPALPTAKSGTADGPEWTRYSNVDMVLIHPRISYYEDPTQWNAENSHLFAFIAYARHLGKIATFAMEDIADQEGEPVSEDRIRSLIPMLAQAGGGMGWVTSPSGQLAWDEELEIIAEYTDLFEPDNRSVNIPEIAILVDPKGEQVEYSLSMLKSRCVDRKDFYPTLYNAGIEIDPLETAEVIADPQILDNYIGIVVANIARLDTNVALILDNYTQSGGGLFIAGRTGIFDSVGNNDYTALKTLLGLSSMLTDDATSYATWSFDSSSDPLL